MKIVKRIPLGIPWLIVGLLGAVILAMGLLRPKPKAPEAPQERPVPVRVMTVVPHGLEDAIELAGRLEPSRQAWLAAEKPGRIVAVKADRGDGVRAGQLLMQIDDRTWQAGLKAAEFEKADAARDLERWDAMKRSGAVPDSDFDKIRLRAEMAGLALDQATIHISQCKIVAPFAGTVEDRGADDGEYAREGDPMFRLVDLSRIKVVFDVPEREVLSLTRGKRVEFRVASHGAQAFTGEVTFVSSDGSRESNTYRAELLVENPEQRLKAGMIAKVRLVRKWNDDAIILPLGAVIPRKGDKVVFVVKDGRAARRLVKIESLSARDVVVSEGVKPGEAVVVEGQRALQDGVRVEVRDAASGGDGEEKRGP